MNAVKKDIGVMQGYALDLAFGKSENDFECKIARDAHCCEEGYFLYYENSEYGGMIDDIGVDTDAEEVTYYGRTWHGILNSKILEPDTGEDYLILTGEANAILGVLIERMGLESLFTASKEDSKIMISKYKMNRYISGYDGIRKMLKEFAGKLNCVFRDGFVELSASFVVDYSKDEQFDTDQIGFKIKKKGNPLNHVVCLGKGDLAEREVLHVYADANGNICEEQSITGINEVAAVYDYPSAESSEELKRGGIDKIITSWNSDEVNFDFVSDKEKYDIGDIVGAIEDVTGVEVSREITKKIVTIQNNVTTISYEVGDK